MIEARLVVDPDTLRPGTLGPATGDVWLSVRDAAFPADGWNDFVVVVLRAWAEAILELLRGGRARKVHFMEGPYVVELERRSDHSWLVRLVERGSAPTVREEGVVASRPLIDSVVGAAESILDACRRTSCWSRDAEELARVRDAVVTEIVRDER